VVRTREANQTRPRCLIRRWMSIGAGPSMKRFHSSDPETQPISAQNASLTHQRPPETSRFWGLFSRSDHMNPAIVGCVVPFRFPPAFTIALTPPLLPNDRESNGGTNAIRAVPKGVIKPSDDYELCLLDSVGIAWGGECSLRSRRMWSGDSVGS
jgi:hypothetical protein